MVRRGFTLLEVLIATVILGLGLTAILVSMMQAQKMMLASSAMETVQEVMDLGEIAYPLIDVQDPEQDLDVSEVRASELWEKVSDIRLTSEQEEKLHGFYWSREWVNKNDDDEIERLGGLHIVRVTVRWGDDFRGHSERESYVQLWRKNE